MDDTILFYASISWIRNLGIERCVLALGQRKKRAVAPWLLSCQSSDG